MTSEQYDTMLEDQQYKWGEPAATGRNGAVLAVEPQGDDLSWLNGAVVF